MAIFNKNSCTLLKSTLEGRFHNFILPIMIRLLYYRTVC